MNKYIHSICYRCEKEESVSLNDILKAGKNSAALPNGWTYRDLGNTGPEPYELCESCSREYKEKEKKEFRNFVNETAPKSLLQDKNT